MNHLAHALLAGDDEGLRLGGMLGDFVHGPPASLPFSPPVVRGIRLHRAIDVYTDAHPEVLAAKALLPSPYRRYAGILLDMWFDHHLARQFSRWSTLPLAPFSERLRGLLHQHDPHLPENLRRFSRYMDAHDLPAGYADPAKLERALAGIGQRLARANPLATAMPVLIEHDVQLRQHFEAFFPDLRSYVVAWINRES